MKALLSSIFSLTLQFLILLRKVSPLQSAYRCEASYFHNHALHNNLSPLTSEVAKTIALAI